jgi:hypothetical protein
MSVVDQLARQASRFANDVQVSLKRARVEGERRLLQRQHRAALEDLGLRAYELIRAGELPEEPLATEVAAIDRKLIELEAKEREITQLQEDEDGTRAEEAGDDAVDTAFPMMGNAAAEQSTDPHEGPPTNPGPGWEATDRFFRRDR